MGFLIKKRIRAAVDSKDLLVSRLVVGFCAILIALNIAFFVLFPRLMAPVSIILSNVVTLLLALIALHPAQALIQNTLAKRQEELEARVAKEESLKKQLATLETKNRELENRLDTRLQTDAAPGDLNFTFKLEQMEYAKTGYLVKEEPLDALRDDERLRTLIPKAGLLDKMLGAIRLKPASTRKILYLRKYYYKVSLGIDFGKIKFAFCEDRILFSGARFTRLHDISGELEHDARDINHCWVMDSAEEEGRAEILQSFDYDSLIFAYEDIQDVETRRSLDEETERLCKQFTAIFRRNITTRFPQVGFVDGIDDSELTWYALRDGGAFPTVREVAANMVQLSNVIEDLSSRTAALPEATE